MSEGKEREVGENRTFEMWRKIVRVNKYALGWVWLRERRANIQFQTSQGMNGKTGVPGDPLVGHSCCPDSRDQERGGDNVDGEIK